MRASVLAPAAAMLAVSAGPADAGDGPVAYLVNDVKGVVGSHAPAGAAGLLNPVVPLPATVDGVVSLAKGTAQVRRTGGGAQEAVADLGKGLVNTAGADLAFSGISAKCLTTADGKVRGVTKVIKGRLTGATGGTLPDAPALPAAPPANFKVPTSDPGMVVMLNKQVRDPLGGMTVAGLSVDSAPGTAGATREFGVARCAPVDKATGALGAVRPGLPGARRTAGDPVTALIERLTSAVQPGLPVLGGLGNPQVAQTGLPVDATKLVLPAVPAAPALPAAPAAPAAPAMPGAPAIPVAVPAAPAAALPHVPVNVQGGLSGVLGGLPGLTGMVPPAAVPALPAVPMAN